MPAPTMASPEPPAADEALPPEDPPPPLVYVQASDDQLPRSAGLRLHLVRPWDSIPYREIGGSRSSTPSGDSARWELNPLDESSAKREFWGIIDGGAFDELSSDALSAWSGGGYRLRVLVRGFREVVMDGPPQPLGDVLTVRLEPAGAVAHYRGRVLDDRGRPLAGAGVFAMSPEGPGVRADNEGRFDLALPLEDGPYDYPRILSAVALGYFSVTLRGQPHGEEGIEFSLRPDEMHGHLVLRLLRSDGRPAARARAWIFREGSSWQEALGWGAVFGDEGPFVDGSGIVRDGGTITRQLLARLVGGQATDDQGYEFAQDAGPLLNDLVADEGGRISIPAIPPGTYHLRAALARPTGGTRVYYPPECRSFNVQQALDTTITIDPPPRTTEIELRLQAGRTVTGRIEVAENPAWHCDHREHRHFILVDDWEWTQVVVRSGASERDGNTPLTGRFRFDGLPRTACALRIYTSGYHPVVVIPLPGVPENATEPFDLGTITVPAARAMQVLLLGEDDSVIEHWSGTVEIRGVPDALPQRWAAVRDTVMLPTQPRAGASIVVLAKGRDEPVAIAYAPFDFAKDRPLVIRVPESKTTPTDGPK